MRLRSKDELDTGFPGFEIRYLGQFLDICVSNFVKWWQVIDSWARIEPRYSMALVTGVEDIIERYHRT